jgi:hypothetical protein
MPADASPAADFVVDRTDLRRCRFVPAPVAGEIRLAPAQALLRVDRFAFTANNVTYAVAGDMMSYWSFFPAEQGWGRVPVWGFADVLDDGDSGLRRGERVFGYLPMSTHVVLQVARLTPSGFDEDSLHPHEQPPVYNQYSRSAGDPGYDAAREDEQMLFRPLFMTAFLLDDFLADNDFFGARTVVLCSASSKTAFSLAHLLHSRGGACGVIGLTSPGNVAFVERLGCYDRIVTYDAIGSLPASQPVAVVDMAGNGKVVAALHHHYRDNLKHNSIVGVTHWEGRDGAAADLPGAQPSFFFAPTQLQKRTSEWGPGGLEQRYGGAWRRFLDFVADKIRVVHGRGRAAVERVYRESVDGKVRPDEGHVLSLWD